jgi:hypothetical protein
LDHHSSNDARTAREHDKSARWASRSWIRPTAGGGTRDVERRGRQRVPAPVIIMLVVTVIATIFLG